MFDALNARIVLITGERQVGKSTALSRAVTDLCNANHRVSGLLTRRTGPHDLEVAEIHSGVTYALTDPFTPSHTSPTRNFAMNTAALLRSSEALAASFPTDVFVLDEIGPLELIHHQGWVGAINLLHRDDYRIAFIVVRPEMLGAAVAELPGTGFGLIRVTPANRDAVPEQLTHLAIAAGARSARTTPECTTPGEGRT